MKIAIIGAAGWIGNEVLQEAKSRGHQIIALVRDPSKITQSDVEVRAFDITDNSQSLAAAVLDADVVVSSVSGRHNNDHSIFSIAAKRYLTELPQSSVNRLVWVGGAGSLEVAPGVQLVNTEHFPEEYKAEALGMGDALKVFKQSDSRLNWTFISPAAVLFPGEKSGHYRTGKDQLLVDSAGDSKISGSDFAVALVDEIESAQNPQQRICVAY
ncbi:MAG: NAD(P)-dependent oxidoreductase [Oceanospirillaceae bacterium]|nr:NAD(P)-dependent oxidoreductase [Oceanospirillaceae bacterium]